MKTLFTVDYRDYEPDWDIFVRDSARCILLREGKIAATYSKKYGYYMFPGGGIEAGEDPAQAVVREVAEETGLQVATEALRPYGQVLLRKRSTLPGDERRIYQQMNYYYLCDRWTEGAPVGLVDYEIEHDYVTAFVTATEAIAANRAVDASIADAWFVYAVRRDTQVYELLLKEQLAE